MPGLSQDDFIARVRTGLAERGPRVDLPDDLEIARVIRSDGDVMATYLERLDQAKIHAYRAADEDALVKQLMQVVLAAGAKSALVPEEDIPARAAILDALRSAGVNLCDVDDPDIAFSADCGITAVSMAVAETGGFVVSSGGPRRRLASLAVPIHIGIIRAEQLVPDLLDWAVKLPKEPPANQVLVSGPSKTADIELTLVMGVHGPKEEHVIILGN
jgi:L-lactate dehydrogenase complex protein LldG